MKITFYPGCSLESTAEEYKNSLIEALRFLNIDLVELEDWNCCGATSAHNIDSRLGINLPARNLFQASKTTDLLLTPCAACYNRQKVAEIRLSEDFEFKDEMETFLGRRYERNVKVQNILEFLNDRIDLIKTKVKKPLTHLKVVCYYGCLLTRPPKITGETYFENPQTMDSIATALGAEAIDWSYKTECCGGSLSIARTDIVVRLVSKIMRMAREAGADAIVTACPLCQMNLDSRQREAETMTGEKIQIPILFISELLAAACGYQKLKIFWRKHMVNPQPVLQENRQGMELSG